MTNARNHTRNKISAFAEAEIDKDVRRDVCRVGRRHAEKLKSRRTKSGGKKKTGETGMRGRVVPMGKM